MKYTKIMIIAVILACFVGTAQAEDYYNNNKDQYGFSNTPYSSTSTQSQRNYDNSYRSRSHDSSFDRETHYQNQRRNDEINSWSKSPYQNQRRNDEINSWSKSPFLK